MPINSVYVQIMNAVVTTIKALITAETMTGITTAAVSYATANKRKERVEFGVPSITVMLPDGAEIHDPRGGTNVHEHVVYPVVVLIIQDIRGDVDNDSQDGTQHQTEKLDACELWREQIRDAFWRQRLTITDSNVCVYDCIYRPMRVLDQTEWRARNLWSSIIRLDFYTRHYRG